MLIRSRNVLSVGSFTDGASWSALLVRMAIRGFNPTCSSQGIAQVKLWSVRVADTY